MYKTSTEEQREAIIRAISKRPNTRFAKLFNELDSAPSQKNIVLLLLELTQQKDFYVDFDISLQYFLNLYEKLDAANKEFLFNEAGLLIYNATQIYSRRVDCVQQRMEDQLAELSSGQESKATNNPDESTPEKTPEKPKRRKRLIEASDPYEIEIVSRKFRKLTPVKRFAPGTKLDTSKLFNQNLHTETYTHPALWQHAEIIDLDNDEEYDTKKNYRLFTNHIEHRYNTLVPDINFRLYFKMKDFMDEEDERDGESEFCQDSDWPPLSQAYVKRYIDLEDQALAQDRTSLKRKRVNSSTLENDDSGRNSPCDRTAEVTLPLDSGIDTSFLQTSNDETSILNSAPKSISAENNNEASAGITDATQQLGLNSEAVEPSLADSGISLSFDQSTCSQDQNLNNTEVNTTTENETESSNTIDSALELNKDSQETNDMSMNEKHTEHDVSAEDKSDEPLKLETAINSTMIAEQDSQMLETDGLSKKEIDDVLLSKEQLEELNDKTEDETTKKPLDDVLEIFVHIESDKKENCVSTDSCASLSPNNDEGVYFSDTDDAPLTPYTINLDCKTINEFQEKENEENVKDAEIYNLPDVPLHKVWPITINIFQFPPEILRKMRRKLLLTNLGDDMEIFLKSRCYKRTRTVDPSSNQRQPKLMRLFRTDSPTTADLYTPPPSPQSDIDLLGFTEDGEMVTQRHIEEVKRIDTPVSPLGADNNRRLSRDSGVGNDLLTATPDKNTMFFPPIVEENEEARRDLFSNNESNEIGILENVLLTPPREVPLNESEKVADGSIAIQAVVEDNKTETVFPKISDDNATEAININEKHLDLSGETAAKIQKWHRHLQPILANSRERHHFDVFQIGTNIIDEFSAEKSITFQTIMGEQDPSLVSRYFLSTLLLANQGNIELSVNNKCDGQPSEWHDLNLKLISTTRHVVSMEDNIGLKITEKTPTTVESSPAKKRCVSTVNVNINRIETVKPISKVSRKSDDYDSGIYSNDDFDNLS